MDLPHKSSLRVQWVLLFQHIYLQLSQYAFYHLLICFLDHFYLQFFIFHSYIVCQNIGISYFSIKKFLVKKLLQKNQPISNSDILYIRKLVRIGSNVRIPGDLHYKNRNIVLAFLKK